jgi:ribosomal protein S4E
MNEPLYRLAYISSNEIAGDDATIRSEIEQILASARIKNPDSDITGALMFNEGYFAQILEGSHDEIQATFERIQCDPRHSQVVILSFEPASERRFSKWSMAYLGTDSAASSMFADITQASGFDPTKLNGDRILELLKEHLLEA